MTTYHNLPLIPRAVSLLAYLEAVQDPGMHVEVMYLHGEPLGRANHFTKEDMMALIEAGIQKLEEEPPRKMGPLKDDHPLVTDASFCRACHEEFAEGDYVGLMPLGPGNSPEGRRKAREGRPYTAAAIPLHWACMTGEEEEEQHADEGQRDSNLPDDHGIPEPGQEDEGLAGDQQQ